MTNEEPLAVVKACVDIVRKVVREDGGDSRYGVVRKGEASLCRGRRGSVRKGASGTEDRDIGRSWGINGRRGLEVFVSGSSHENVVGVNGDILVKRGE